MGRRGLAAPLVAAAAFCALALGGRASATTYYVSARGSDAANGRSPATAWRSVARVNAARLAPGDRVLFEGGGVFDDVTLIPSQSGTPRSPIVFSSYGRGDATIANSRGAVWFSGAHDLVFSRLRLTTGGAPANVFSGSASAGSARITLRQSVVVNTAGPGIVAPSAQDAHWTVTRTRVAHTGDSGLILLGTGHVIAHTTIVDTGWNGAIPYGRHGIYSKGPDQTIEDNDLSRDQGGQEISVRFHGTHVVANRIHDAPYAIGFFDDDTARAPQGTSWILRNQLWNISGWAFYYSGEADPNGAPPNVGFAVSRNQVRLSGASVAVDVSESGSAHVALLNNVFSGTFGTGLRSATTTVARGNLWNRSKT